MLFITLGSVERAKLVPPIVTNPQSSLPLLRLRLILGSSQIVMNTSFHILRLYIIAIAAIPLLSAANLLHAQENLRPNILFISVDDLAPELSFYGNSIVKTPAMDRLAESAFVFERAYCQVPVCGASRASLLTGLLPTADRFTRFNSRADEDAPDVPTLPQIFKENGYLTISNGKVFHSQDDSAPESWSPKPWRPSISHAKENDPASKQFRGGLRNRGPFYESTDVDDDAYFDGLVAKKTIRDLNKVKNANKPFFIACGFIRPHLPFYAPKKYWDLYDPAEIPLATFRELPNDAPESLKGSGEIRFYDMRGLEYNSDEFHKMARWGYYASISYIDAQIGRILNTLEANGQAENTIVVIWGDHGFHLGDHDIWGKLTNLHTSLRVPLLIKLPGSMREQRITSIVELVDLYPTLCDLVGIKKPAHLQGDSLLPLIEGAVEEDVLDSAYSRMFEGDTVISSNYIYTEYNNKGDHEAMFYDLVNDPLETQNELRSDNYKSRVAVHAGLLRDHIDKAQQFDSSKPLRIMPLGDSLTRGRNGDTRDFTGGYRKHLEVILDDSFSPNEWSFVGEMSNDSPNMRNKRHQGIGGIDTDGIMAGSFKKHKNSRVDIMVSTQSPDIILFNVGTNDLSRKKANIAFADYTELLEAIWQASPDTIVIANTLLGRYGEDKQVVNKRFIEFNRLLRAKAVDWKQSEKFYLVDMSPLVDTESPDDLPDSVHPSRALYKEMAKELSKILVPVMEKQIQVR